MTRTPGASTKCPICRETRPAREIVHADLVHRPLLDLVRAAHPEGSESRVICLDCLRQNRLEARDRLRAEHDYRVNLKAALEIRHLHWKMDWLLTHQWRRPLEIQQIPTDLMEEPVHRRRA
jgi:Protein of unknown function (DUF1003)